MKKLISCILAAAMSVQGIGFRTFAEETAGVLSFGQASVETVSGETFSLPLNIESNPGVTAIGIRLFYDSALLELVGAEDAHLLGASEYLAGEDLTKDGYTLIWDDIAAENHTETGTLANLTFRAKPFASGTVSIYANVQDGSAYNVDLEDVAFQRAECAVKIQRSTELPTISADTVIGVGGDEVDIPIRIAKNPGITALGLDVSYSTERLELLRIQDSGLFEGAEFLASEKLSASTVKLLWDDVKTENHTENGILAVLSFRVKGNAAADAPVRISLQPGSVYDVDLQDVTFLVQNGGVKYPTLEDLMVNGDRKPLKYLIEASDTPANVLAAAQSVSHDSIMQSSYTNNTSYNNGFGFLNNTDVLHEGQDDSGRNAAFYDAGDTVLIFTEGSEEPLIIQKADWKYGAGTFGADHSIYVLWGKTIPESDISASLSTVNVVIAKYDLTGKLIAEAGLPVSGMKAQYPFAGGNAAIGYKDGIVLAVFNTEWTKSSDGRNHQGSCYLAVNAESMKVQDYSTWQGSHSFGVSMLPTSYGFALIQMGDADAGRGINLNLYGIYHGILMTDAKNGYRTVFHASGQYGTNEKQLDGNSTYTHMGGIAKSRTTYAVAGKAERVYTDEVHYSSSVPTDDYDVFVRILDQKLTAADDLAGEARINGHLGTAVDSNVVWLTACNEKEKAGAVKVVTLSDGAYCVLWEKFADNKFDSVRYVILDECGNVLRPESEIRDARLSDNATQPASDGYTLHWAVSDGASNTLKWYSVNLLDSAAPAVTTMPAATTTSKATTTTTKAITTTIKAATTTAKATITTAKATTTTAKATITTAKAATTTAKATTTTAKATTTTAKAATTTTVKATTTTAKATTTTAKATTTTVKATTTTIKATTTTAKVTTTTAKATITTVKATTTTIKATTTTAKVTTTTAKVTTTSAPATTTTAKATTTTAQATTTTEAITTTSETTTQSTTTAITSDGGTDTTPAQTTTTAPPEPEPLKGDVDGSDDVSIEDVQTALKAYTVRVSGKDHGLTAKQVKAADVNEDGELSVDDVQNILIYYVNNTVAGKVLTWDDILGKKAQAQPRPELLTMHEDIWIDADKMMLDEQ